MIDVGTGYRASMKSWIRSSDARKQVHCLEITAEHFFDGSDDLLHELRQDYPLFVHGLGLSLGTPGPLDAPTLERFAAVADAADAKWVSEHIAFTRAGGVDLGHLNPVPHTRAMLDTLVEHTRQVAQRCCRPILLENITSHLPIGGEMDETDFINELCHRADCGLLLDVTNLFINSRNHDFDPIVWLDRIDTARITQLHIVGYNYHDGCYHDSHAARIQNDVMALLSIVLERAPVQAVILERDDEPILIDPIMDELKRLEQAVECIAHTD